MLKFKLKLNRQTCIKSLVTAEKTPFLVCANYSAKALIFKLNKLRHRKKNQIIAL